MKKSKTPRAALIALILFLFCLNLPGASFAAEGEFSDVPADSSPAYSASAARPSGASGPFPTIRGAMTFGRISARSGESAPNR
jgi:hypothetical protein